MNPNGRCREIVVNSHSGYSHKVEYYFGCYDSLQYPLMFPFGDTGWHQGIRKIDKHKRQFYCEGQFMIDPNKMASVAEMLDKEAEGIWRVQDLFSLLMAFLFIYDICLLLFVLLFAVMGMRKKRDMVSCREYYCYKL